MRDPLRLPDNADQCAGYPADHAPGVPTSCFVGGQAVIRMGVTIVCVEAGMMKDAGFWYVLIYAYEEYINSTTN